MIKYLYGNMRPPEILTIASYIIVICNNCAETDSRPAELFANGKTPEITCQRCGDGRMAPIPTGQLSGPSSPPSAVNNN